MRRTWFLLVLLLVGCSGAMAKSISGNTAKKVATTYLQQHSITSEVNLAYPSGDLSNKLQAPLLYIFNAGNGEGFVIISGDDNASPILGYATAGAYNEETLPPNFRKWLDGYKRELDYIIHHEIQATPSISREWAELMAGSWTSPSNKKGSVSPLIDTKWNQSPYVNNACPSRSVTGCVATMMAQIMKFWEYPATGTGFHSYNENDYGTLSANFGSTTYEWSSMPNTVTRSNSAVATLMYHCGVSVDMDYSPSSSGAYVISDRSPVTHCSEYAFETYFGYDKGLKGVERDDYSSNSWIQLVKGELDASRPIAYAGFGNGGGHAFVCDGYDNNDFFHFNWGWGGSYDGYFSINSLNPSGTGTGGGTGGYNSGHQAIIGIKPPDGNQSYDIKLYANVYTSNTTIYYGQAFDIETNVLNSGSNTFKGDYAAAIFDANSNFIDYVEIQADMELSGGYVYRNGLTFSTDGLLSMLPGEYTIGIYFRPNGGNWGFVSDNGSYRNSLRMSVIYPNDIELNSEITATPSGTWTKGKEASVNLNVVNDGSSTFEGKYSVDLYNLDGSHVEEINTHDETQGLPAGYTYRSPYLTFSSSSISAEPGTYLLAIQYKKDGGSWELVGSTDFQNPVYIIVEAAEGKKDKYEANDDESSAYALQLSFNNNKASVATTGSNNHHGADYDYYEIDLPAGYKYTIEAQAHDAYSGNGQTYTNDVLWSYSVGGKWSDAYDDVMTSDIVVNNGGKVMFHVAPYFEGETGTYLLDINISRTEISSTNEASMMGWNVFPVPTTDAVYLKHPNTESIQSITVLDAMGRRVKNVNIQDAGQLQTISTDELLPGIYFLDIRSETATRRIQIIKS